MGREFYHTEEITEVNNQNEPVSGYIVEEKYCRNDTSSKKKYFFIISNPKTYSLKTIEVGKYTYGEYDEGDELD